MQTTEPPAPFEMRASLDARQLKVIKDLVIELAGEAASQPNAKAAARCEAMAIILDSIGLPTAAECARHAACRLSEGGIAYRELLQTLETLQ